MFGQYFYNKHLRNTVIAFGTIFNTIGVRRYDSNGNAVSSLRVPLMYAPREKFLARLQQQTTLGSGSEERVAITLPRLSFEMTGISYDPSRKINKNLKYKKAKSADDNKVFTQFAPVPYNMGFNLYSFTANSDDGLQIVEQILPFFQPDYTVTMIEDRTMDIKRDIPFVLNSVDYEDTYDGDMTSNRRIIYTMNFTAKIYLYGPITSGAVIRQEGVDLYTKPQSESPSRQERVKVTPNPTSADYDDDYTYTETLEFFDDGLNYDESSGLDK